MLDVAQLMPILIIGLVSDALARLLARFVQHAVEAIERRRWTESRLNAHAEEGVQIAEELLTAFQDVVFSTGKTKGKVILTGKTPKWYRWFCGDVQRGIRDSGALMIVDTGPFEASHPRNAKTPFARSDRTRANALQQMTAHVQGSDALHDLNERLARVKSAHDEDAEACS